jgi:1-deoxy-D-xylulose-5-phosphate synthase
MRFVKPLDESMVLELARKHDLLVTLEENALSGGAGSAVHECLMRRNVQVPLLQLGLPDRFIEHGTRDEALRDAGLDREGIRQSITTRLPHVARGSARVHALPTTLPSPRRAGGATRAVAAQKAD